MNEYLQKNHYHKKVLKKKWMNICKNKIIIRNKYLKKKESEWIFEKKNYSEKVLKKKKVN